MKRRRTRFTGGRNPISSHFSHSGGEDPPGGTSSPSSPPLVDPRREAIVFLRGLVAKSAVLGAKVIFEAQHGDVVLSLGGARKVADPTHYVEYERIPLEILGEMVRGVKILKQMDLGLGGPNSQTST